MRLIEFLDVVNGNQLVDVYYKDRRGDLVKCAYNSDTHIIDDKYDDAEVMNVSVTKYNTIDVLIENIVKTKRYTVNFSISDWISLDESVEIEFEDGESEEEIFERIDDEFRDWLDDKLEELRSYADKEIEEIEEF